MEQVIRQMIIQVKGIQSETIKNSQEFSWLFYIYSWKIKDIFLLSGWLIV
jgi:hypothetical protein